MPVAVNAMKDCDTLSGSINIVKGDRAFISLKNARKQLDLAEKAAAANEVSKLKNNLKNAEKYLGFVLKKEPSANINEECSRLSALKNNAGSLAKNKEDFARTNADFTFFVDNYYNFAGGVFEGNNFTQQRKVFDNIVNVDRNKLLLKIQKSEANGSLDYQGKQLKQKLENIDQLLTANQIPSTLNKMLDEVNKSDGVKKSQMSNRVLKVVRGFAAIGGDHPTLIAIKNTAERQLSDAKAEMSSVYTSDFHKKHVNQIVFTKKPFKAGSESSVEINPIFQTGDAVIATVYLSAPIIDAIGDPNALSSTGQKTGAGGAMRVTDPSSGLTLDRFFTADEGGYKNTMLYVHPDSDTTVTTYQFVLVPNLSSSLKKDIKFKNITPIQMARGMGKETPRKKTWNVNFTINALKTGAVSYQGSFTMDLSKGAGPEYYANVESKQYEHYIEANELPRAAFSDAELESTLLAIMNGSGFKETYTKALLQTKWKVFKPPFKQRYKEMVAAFPYKTKDGQCGYRTHTFRSYNTGSGWGDIEKFGGALARERVSCKKMK